MIRDLSLDDFLSRNRLTTEVWGQSRLEWPTLVTIGVDHEDNYHRLLQSAEFFARLIQKFAKVHSVRWRVKDSEHLLEHLLEKIVRKRVEGAEKYTDISIDNYYTVVTDLVGVRALHLFKDDCFAIDEELRATWNPIEPPVAYIRAGDQDDLTKQLTDRGFEIKVHPAGYRSVHYVFESLPFQRKVIAEVQVRTIFEEGWSEIDHKVRYPNFLSNHLVDYFLAIFNRMAGSADEMGGFVRNLISKIQESERQIAQANKEKEESIAKVKDALKYLESADKHRRSADKHLKRYNQRNEELGKTLDRIDSELDKLKNMDVRELFPSIDSEVYNFVETVISRVMKDQEIDWPSLSAKLLKNARSKLNLDQEEKLR